MSLYQELIDVMMTAALDAELQRRNVESCLDLESLDRSWQGEFYRDPSTPVWATVSFDVPAGHESAWATWNEIGDWPDSYNTDLVIEVAFHLRLDRNSGETRGALEQWISYKLHLSEHENLRQVALRLRNSIAPALLAAGQETGWYSEDNEMPVMNTTVEGFLQIGHELEYELPVSTRPELLFQELGVEWEIIVTGQEIADDPGECWLLLMPMIRAGIDAATAVFGEIVHDFGRGSGAG